jgi:hypothetical protein
MDTFTLIFSKIYTSLVVADAIGNVGKAAFYSNIPSNIQGKCREEVLGIIEKKE